MASVDGRFQRRRDRPRDFSCQERSLRPGPLVKEGELAGLGSFPLLEVLDSARRAGVNTTPQIPPPQISNVLAELQHTQNLLEKDNAVAETKKNGKQRPPLPLPFPKKSYELSGPVGSSMIQRMEKSMVDYELRLSRAKRDARTLNGGSEMAIELFKVCIDELQSTRTQVQEALAELESEANQNQLAPVHGYDNLTGYLRFQLAKACWLEPHVEVPLVLGSLLSSHGVAQIRDANPLLPVSVARGLLQKAATIMFRCSRISQLQRCIEQAKKLLASKVSSESAKGLANAFCEQRHHPTLSPSLLSFDPRFLYFEFSSGYLLWKRQVC